MSTMRYLERALLVQAEKHVSASATKDFLALADDALDPSVDRSRFLRGGKAVDKLIQDLCIPGYAKLDACERDCVVFVNSAWRPDHQFQDLDDCPV